MFQQQAPVLVSPSSPPTLEIILRSIRSLLAPQAAVYYACNRERVEKQAEQLATLDVELENIRKQVFAAGARLMALQQHAPGEGGAV